MRKAILWKLNAGGSAQRCKCQIQELWSANGGADGSAMLKNNKAPECDGTRTEMIKEKENEGIEINHPICSQVLESGKWPQYWIYWYLYHYVRKDKTGNAKIIKQLQARILHISSIKVWNHSSKDIPQAVQGQAGFVPDKGTEKQILNLKQLTEKAQDHNVPVLICFLVYKNQLTCVMWNQ